MNANFVVGSALKPDERVSADQKAEIALLQSLNLPSWVLRLIEL